MAIEMKMPRLSDTMEQGTIVRWAVKPGQKVRSGDVVADIETDKATMELQTFDDGTVAKLAVSEGQQAPVGTVILVLAEAGENTDAIAAQGVSAAPQRNAAAASSGSIGQTASASTLAPVASAGVPSAASQTNGQHSSNERVFASPLAKKIAAESGVDLSGVHGTGPSGRIVRKDVEAALSSSGAVFAPPRVLAPAESSKISGLSAGAVPGVALPPIDSRLATRAVALSNMRAIIAKRLVQSKASIPHYQVTVSARMDALMSLRQQLNDQLASQGVKLSVNDFVVRACALAMHQHPYINARWVEAQGQQPRTDFVGDVNVGVAIALPINERGEGGGLVVGTIRHADRLGLRLISAETKRLSEKAKSKGLSVEEMSDSTFTISNLGMFGVDHFTAIINPPNAAILAVGAAIEQPVVAKDSKTGEKKIAVGTLMQMTMSSDHRIIDGAMAAQFLGTVKALLEAPATLLV